MERQCSVKYGLRYGKRPEYVLACREVYIQGFSYGISRVYSFSINKF